MDQNPSYQNLKYPYFILLALFNIFPLFLSSPDIFLYNKRKKSLKQKNSKLKVRKLSYQWLRLFLSLNIQKLDILSECRRKNPVCKKKRELNGLSLPAMCIQETNLLKTQIVCRYFRTLIPMFLYGHKKTPQHLRSSGLSLCILFVKL